MKSFVQHNIQEKVSQKEFKDARSDKNILIGLEFEVEDVEFAGATGWDIELVQNDYNSYVGEIYDFCIEIHETYSAWMDDITSQMAIVTKDLKMDLINTQDPDETKDLEDKISEIEDQSWQDYAEEHDLGNWMDDISDPYFDPGSYEEWLKMTTGDELPSRQEIINWAFEATDWGETEITTLVIATDLLGSYPSPENDNYGDDAEFDEDDLSFKNLVKDVMKGKQPEVGDYHGSSNYSKWRVEKDSSLGNTGAEIISPILPLNDGIEAIENMFDWINKYGDTANSTGFHVNMSFKGYDMKKFDWLKLLMFVEEGAIYKDFENRKGNNYATSLMSYFDGTLSIDSNIGSKKYYDAIGKNSASGMNRIKEKLRAGKFFGVNFSSIIKGSDNARIEFRYMGGRYHLKKKQVVENILRYAAWMRIALDPNYKKEEYIKKMMRMVAKQEEDNRPDKIIMDTKLIGISYGTSRKSVVWHIRYDPKKKMVYVMGANRNLIHEYPVKKAYKNKRLKKSLDLLGITIKDLMSGNVKSL